MPDEKGRETDDEARARVEQVRATQIFGDTPTDPTIGDTVAVAHDEEAANVAAAEVDARAEDGDEAAADLSPEEAKRQFEPLSAQGVQDDVDFDGDGEADATDNDADDLSREEKINQIEAASSKEEVDRLAEGDERVTVTRAADKRREELS